MCYLNQTSGKCIEPLNVLQLFDIFNVSLDDASDRLINATLWMAMDNETVWDQYRHLFDNDLKLQAKPDYNPSSSDSEILMNGLVVWERGQKPLNPREIEVMMQQLEEDQRLWELRYGQRNITDDSLVVKHIRTNFMIAEPFNSANVMESQQKD